MFTSVKSENIIIIYNSEYVLDLDVGTALNYILIDKNNFLDSSEIASTLIQVEHNKITY